MTNGGEARINIDGEEREPPRLARAFLVELATKPPPPSRRCSPRRRRTRTSTRSTRSRQRSRGRAARRRQHIAPAGRHALHPRLASMRGRRRRAAEHTPPAPKEPETANDARVGSPGTGGEKAGANRGKAPSGRSRSQPEAMNAGDVQHLSARNVIENDNSKHIVDVACGTIGLPLLMRAAGEEHRRRSLRRAVLDARAHRQRVPAQRASRPEYKEAARSAEPLDQVAASFIFFAAYAPTFGRGWRRSPRRSRDDGLLGQTSAAMEAGVSPRRRAPPRCVDASASFESGRSTQKCRSTNWSARPIRDRRGVVRRPRARAQRGALHRSRSQESRAATRATVIGTIFFWCSSSPSATCRPMRASAASTRRRSGFGSATHAALSSCSRRRRTPALRLLSPSLGQRDDWRDVASRGSRSSRTFTCGTAPRDAAAPAEDVAASSSSRSAAAVPPALGRHAGASAVDQP